MVNKIVKTTPMTTRYTPISKNSAEPIIPITGIGSSNHSPVIGGRPKSNGVVTLRAEVANPNGIKDIGLYRSIFMVFSVPLAKLCKTNAIDATNPPTNPPPGK